MGKAVLDVSISLDGFITGQNVSHEQPPEPYSSTRHYRALHFLARELILARFGGSLKERAVSSLRAEPTGSWGC
jgi:hypothetical protein